MKKQFIQFILSKFLAVFLVSTLFAYANDQFVSVPITKFNKTELGTSIYVGKEGENKQKAFVEIDTGSQWLVIEEAYVSNYIKTNRKYKMSYGVGAKTDIEGHIAFADITFESSPSITAKHVPIIIVPNGSMKKVSGSGIHGILGLKMDTQNTPWNYLPEPYNQVMILNGPELNMSFGPSSDTLLKQYHTFQLPQLKGCVNLIKPRSPIDQSKCWVVDTVPVTYTFTNLKGKVIAKDTVNTIFDSGGVDTHFVMPNLPEGIHAKNCAERCLLKHVKIKSATFADSGYYIPMTKNVRYSKGKKRVSNSGFTVFYNKSMLFDLKNGLIGVK
jgi:hypothetical protein